MPAICSICWREMVANGFCITTVLVPRGRDPHSSKTKRTYRIKHAGDVACCDCNVAPGQPHHGGCDQEVCPFCYGQVYGCLCLCDYDEYEMATLWPLERARKSQGA